MKKLEKRLRQLIEEKTAGNIAVRVGQGERVLYETYHGEINEDTLVDMASVSKILCTTSLALMALEEGRIGLEDPLSKYYDYKGEMTLFHLLTHTMGIGHKGLSVEGVNYDNVGEYILSIPSDVAIGSEVLYSCPGFILLGKVLEKVYGERLDALFQKRVCAPLGMEDTGYLPRERSRALNHNPEEKDRGVVNDYNCRHLGGVAGNAGVFSTLRDMGKYAAALTAGLPMIRPETFALARRNHTPDMSAARGLGFLYVDERYEQTGGLFPVGSIGHAGHTGQSVFVHPESGMHVVILSDATVSVQKKYGKSRYEEVCAMRAAIHAAIREDLNL